MLTERGISSNTLLGLLFSVKPPGKPSPPQPILTKLGSWKLAEVNHAENFEVSASVVDALDENGAMEIAQKL